MTSRKVKRRDRLAAARFERRRGKGIQNLVHLREQRRGLIEEVVEASSFNGRTPALQAENAGSTPADATTDPPIAEGRRAQEHP
jgi:hypothetical protein